jgi:hypothetical protein
MERASNAGENTYAKGWRNLGLEIKPITTEGSGAEQIEKNLEMQTSLRNIDYALSKLRR